LVTSDGFVTTIAGSSQAPGSFDGSANAARFRAIFSISFAKKNGSLFVADADNQTIRRISADGIVSTFAGRTDEKEANLRYLARLFDYQNYLKTCIVFPVATTETFTIKNECNFAIHILWYEKDKPDDAGRETYLAARQSIVLTRWGDPQSTTAAVCPTDEDIVTIDGSSDELTTSSFRNKKGSFDFRCLPRH